MLAKIIINRKSEWLNRLRAFKVFIDDKEVGAVKNGSSEEFVVEEGTHNVHIKFGLYKSISLTITLNKGENKFLLTRNGMKYFWPLYILLLVGVVSKLIMIKLGIYNTDWSSYIQLLLVLPSLLYFLFYLTIGRKKYLVLEKDHNNIFNS
jgi:hypothetical protein